MKVEFLSPLDAREITEGNWQLLSPLRWTVTNDDGSVVTLEAPVGFPTNFCSVPPPFEKIANRAGAIHDYAYKVHNMPRQWCDSMLRAGVLACGYDDEIAEAFYIAVRLFGRSHYGWRPDTPSRLDHVFSVSAPVALPPMVDLRPLMPNVYDQGQLGSCTANAIAALIHFDRMKQKVTPSFIPSRLFIYWNERNFEGTVASDAGAEIRDGIDSVANYGVCPEAAIPGFLGWNYRIQDFMVKPSKTCYDQAIKYRAVQRSRVPQNRDAMRQCLAQGYPFAFGFTVYESFESAEVARTGVAPLPGPREQALGGHAVCAVGYDNASERFICRNSWGRSWGQAGYFTLPMSYLEDPNSAADFWTIRLIAA
jgi:Papain family cysteine protease/Protein of unknown function (DUF1353)